MVSKCTSKDAARYHHGLTTKNASATRATTVRAPAARTAQAAATQAIATDSAATRAASWSQSSWTGWGQTLPTSAIGHIASSKWLCQNG